MTRKRWVGLAALIAFTMSSGAQADAALEHAKRLLSNTILLDGHNDLPWAIRTSEVARGDVAAYDLRGPVSGQTDLARLRQGRVGAQIWSVYIPGKAEDGFARMQLEQISIAHEVIRRYPDTFQLARTADDVRAAYRAGRIASLLGMEGGYGIEDSLGALRAYYELGVRFMGLTHNNHTNWADSAMELPAKHGGLTPFGEKVVLEMNRLGMIVDLSHSSLDTVRDTLRVTKAPVIFSHSSAQALCDVPRNVPDEVLKALPKNGGVVMVTFVADFISEEVAKHPALDRYLQRARAAKSDTERAQIYAEEIGRANLPPVTIGQVADHIEHIRKVAGVDHVGLGGDYDGNDLWPEGLSDVSTYPNLFAELIRRGWSDEDLAKLAGGNALRVLEAAERTAKQMQVTARPMADLAR